MLHGVVEWLKGRQGPGAAAGSRVNGGAPGFAGPTLRVPVGPGCKAPGVCQGQCWCLSGEVGETAARTGAGCGELALFVGTAVVMFT